jgi:hypothetical protein
MRQVFLSAAFLALSAFATGLAAQPIHEQWHGFWDSTDSQLIVTPKNIVKSDKICKWVGKAPVAEHTGCVSFYAGTTTKKEMLATLQSMREALRTNNQNMEAKYLAEEKKLVDALESNLQTLSDSTFRVVNTSDADYQGSGDCGNYYIMDKGVAYSVRQCESAGLGSALMITAMRKGPATGPVATLNGNWFSTKWKYGYTLQNGLGTATATNSAKFKVGDEIIILRATSKNTFEGEQVYQDGKFHPITASLLPDGRLQFKGEKNITWIMDRK